MSNLSIFVQPTRSYHILLLAGWAKCRRRSTVNLTARNLVELLARARVLRTEAENSHEDFLKILIF
eukprot:3959322-Pyramimonas_sp.AAC.1